MPLGRYTLAEDGETWIFEPYVPMGDLPQTGMDNTMLLKTLLILGLLALTFGLYISVREN